jgi:hypothetical protein
MISLLYEAVARLQQVFILKYKTSNINAIKKINCVVLSGLWFSSILRFRMYKEL